MDYLGGLICISFVLQDVGAETSYHKIVKIRCSKQRVSLGILLINYNESVFDTWII